MSRPLNFRGRRSAWRPRRRRPAVQRLQQELKANVKHWNELSRSIAKLKDASNALVTKLGSKIDEHEVQIVELQNALSQARQPVAPKPTSP